MDYDLYLRVRLEEGVSQMITTAPIPHSATVRRVQISFREVDGDVSTDHQFLEAMKTVIDHGRLRIEVQSSYGTYTVLVSERVWRTDRNDDGKRTPPPRGARSETTLYQKPWTVRRGDVVKFEATMKSRAPKIPIMLVARLAFGDVDLPGAPS